jgi:transcriptional regulator GlxA family with amidase domain
MALTRRTKPLRVVEARRLYEQTNLPINHIAAMLGFGRTALRKRIQMWGWRLRRPRSAG